MIKMMIDDELWLRPAAGLQYAVIVIDD